MKLRSRAVSTRCPAIPSLRFEPEGEATLTSFSGLVVFQKLFRSLLLFERLQSCFEHVVDRGAAFKPWRIVLVLIVHFLIGYKRLRDIRYYADDPLILRVLGLKRMPDVATISRNMNQVDGESVDLLRNLSRDLVFDRLRESGFSRVTLDFDGSVFSTKRKAEGTSVGDNNNKKKKGERSYYPLFCTVAETAQIFDLLHRPGNVHDSNGSLEFVRASIFKAKELHPAVRLESRMDSAFYNEVLLDELNS